MASVRKLPPLSATPELGVLTTNVLSHSDVFLERPDGARLRLAYSVLPRVAGRRLSVRLGAVTVGTVERLAPARRRRFRFACPGWRVRVERVRPPLPTLTEGRTL
jgi:hypothetical protein